jgi:hypothetical protein
MTIEWTIRRAGIIVLALSALAPAIAGASEKRPPAAPANALRGDRYARYCTPQPKIALRRILVTVRCSRPVVLTESVHYVWQTPAGPTVADYGGGALASLPKGKSTLIDDRPGASYSLCSIAPDGTTGVALRVHLRRNSKASGPAADPNMLRRKILKTRTSGVLKLSC